MSSARPDVPRIIAHRGASGHAPENTIAAFKAAKELGAGWVEFDCMLSLEKRVILNHDETLKRTAGVDSRAADLDLGDLLHLDVGSWFSPKFAFETIPTFQTAMKALGELQLGANVEIKPAKGQDAETARAVITDILCHWPNDVAAPVISSFSREAMEVIAPLLTDRPDIQRAMLWDFIPDDWEEELATLGATAIHCDADHLDKEKARQVIDTGTPLRCFTVNDPEIGKRLFDWGVGSLFTDYPDRFI